MKITINQEEKTSNTVDGLIQLKYQVPTIKIKWIVLPILILLIMYSWQQRVLTWWVLLPFIWTFIVVNHALIARSSREKLQKIEQLKIDPAVWNQLRQQYPELSIKQRRLIELGFKDYLAVHAMQKQAYAMPSNAVDALWHVLLEHPIQYQQLCQQTIGRKLEHHPYDTNLKPEERSKQMLETWRFSCMLHDYHPRNTAQLPRLFAIDQALNWQDGQYFEVEQMTKDFAKYLQDQSSSSSCGSGGCSSCGGD
jgi:hypothetical protein